MFESQPPWIPRPIQKCLSLSGSDIKTFVMNILSDMSSPICLNWLLISSSREINTEMLSPLFSIAKNFCCSRWTVAHFRFLLVYRKQLLSHLIGWPHDSKCTREPSSILVTIISWAFTSSFSHSSDDAAGRFLVPVTTSYTIFAFNTINTWNFHVIQFSPVNLITFWFELSIFRSPAITPSSRRFFSNLKDFVVSFEFFLLVCTHTIFYEPGPITCSLYMCMWVYRVSNTS